MQKYLYVFVAITVGLEAVSCCLGGLSGGRNPDGSMDDYALTTNPTFELSFSPPVEWTVTDDTVDVSADQSDLTSKQASDIGAATRNAQNAIRLSLIDAMVSKDVSITSSTTYDFSKITGQKISIIDPPNNNIDAGLVIDGTVISICDGNNCNEANILTKSFEIKDGPLLTGKQWKDVATALQSSLWLQKVRFDQPIIVTD